MNELKKMKGSNELEFAIMKIWILNMNEWNKILNKAYEQFLNGEKRTHKITRWNECLNWEFEKLT